MQSLALKTLRLELSRSAARRSPAKLRADLARGCFVYGAGGYGRRILRLLSAQNFGCAGHRSEIWSGAGLFH